MNKMGERSLVMGNVVFRNGFVGDWLCAGFYVENRDWKFA